MGINYSVRKYPVLSYVLIDCMGRKNVSLVDKEINHKRLNVFKVNGYTSKVFMPFLQRKTTALTPCLLILGDEIFQKGVYS